ncbi:conserved hypothetical mitochondrial protein [Candida dubliniensis CD36]|uniref:Conserved hypothetical mitochondrial protein n=1 Tax=Candida dubliniensis (strain CD36 / ATCC MYA-646 / CBS 7987 / NCPF 3949 / NRRL Y-17841) TaxID=573826 RepID=B9WLI9_CANDC|nr:conserved hypothetical mitochondrial protein [Candida dubliniensis CD36]CAX39951.1 conserved hypothetical mitochondrial protein [Candida dubliniensis CD36]
MSNILSVFNPPPSRPYPPSPDELESQCLPCTAIQSIVAIGGGLYLSSPNQFKDKTTGKIDLRKNPIWWQRSVRGAGIILFGLGAYRAGEVVQILYRKRFG